MGIIPQLTSFCCGCKLRDGTIIVLALPLISVLLSPFVDSVRIGNQSFLVKVFVSLVLIAVCAAGLYGVYKEKRSFLIPFLVFDVLTIFGGLIAVVQYLIINIGISLLILLFIPLYGYAFLVVLSYYRELGVKKATASSTPA